MSSESQFFDHSIVYRFEREDARVERLLKGAAREMAVCYGPVRFTVSQLSVSVTSTPAILDRFEYTFRKRCQSLGVEYTADFSNAALRH